MENGVENNGLRAAPVNANALGWLNAQMRQENEDATTARGLQTTWQGIASPPSTAPTTSSSSPSVQSRSSWRHIEDEKQVSAPQLVLPPARVTNAHISVVFGGMQQGKTPSLQDLMTEAGGTTHQADLISPTEAWSSSLVLNPSLKTELALTHRQILWQRGCCVGLQKAGKTTILNTMWGLKGATGDLSTIQTTKGSHSTLHKVLRDDGSVLCLTTDSEGITSSDRAVKIEGHIRELAKTNATTAMTLLHLPSTAELQDEGKIREAATNLVLEYGCKHLAFLLASHRYMLYVFQDFSTAETEMHQLNKVVELLDDSIKRNPRWLFLIWNRVKPRDDLLWQEGRTGNSPRTEHEYVKIIKRTSFGKLFDGRVSLVSLPEGKNFNDEWDEGQRNIINGRLKQLVTTIFTELEPEQDDPGNNAEMWVESLPPMVKGNCIHLSWNSTLPSLLSAQLCELLTRACSLVLCSAGRLSRQRLRAGGEPEHAGALQGEAACCV